MNKVVSIATVICLIFLTSCKKDYTCKCTYTVIDQNGNTSTSQDSHIINDTKSNAKDLCDENDGSADYTGYTTTIDCNIE